MKDTCVICVVNLAMRNKHKKRYRSSGSDQLNSSKVLKVRGPSGGSIDGLDDTSVVVSELLNQEKCVLLDNEDKTMDQVFVGKPLETNSNVEIVSGTTLPQDTQYQSKLHPTNKQQIKT